MAVNFLSLADAGRFLEAFPDAPLALPLKVLTLRQPHLTRLLR